MPRGGRPAGPRHRDCSPRRFHSPRRPSPVPSATAALSPAARARGRRPGLTAPPPSRGGSGGSGKVGVGRGGTAGGGAARGSCPLPPSLGSARTLPPSPTERGLPRTTQRSRGAGPGAGVLQGARARAPPRERPIPRGGVGRAGSTCRGRGVPSPAGAAPGPPAPQAPAGLPSRHGGRSQRVPPPPPAGPGLGDAPGRRSARRAGPGVEGGVTGGGTVGGGGPQGAWGARGVGRRGRAARSGTQDPSLRVRSGPGEPGSTSRIPGIAFLLKGVKFK